MLFFSIFSLTALLIFFPTAAVAALFSHLVGMCACANEASRRHDYEQLCEIVMSG